jgi:hypothetical protein
MIESGFVGQTVTTTRADWSRPQPYQLDFRHGIAFQLASIKGVRAVYATRYDHRDQVLFIWTVVSERQEDLYSEIYAIEEQLIDANPKVQFDFTVMPAYGKDPRSLIRDPTAQLIYRAALY